MPRRLFHFDPPDRFVAGTIGRPGNRTFFLQARRAGQVVSVVLEKVQVAVLAERLGFLNAELERAKKAIVARERLIDTLMLARRKHPGGSNRLDDLCTRYKIDNSKRIKHGALLDAELLAEVYIELIGARQANLGLATVVAGIVETRTVSATMLTRATPLTPRVTDEERAAHREFVKTLGDEAIWKKYWPPEAAPEERAAS
jgi:DNA polymerase-3 subunit epsilon